MRLSSRARGTTGTGVAWSSPLSDPEIETTQVIWVVKTDSLGCVIPGCHTVGVQECVLDLNEHLVLWPNPLGGGAPLSVSFSPPAFVPNGPLRMVVLDALGKRVHEQQLPSGTEQVSLPELASGTYHLHLCDDSRWLAVRTVVLQ